MFRSDSTVIKAIANKTTIIQVNNIWSLIETGFKERFAVANAATVQNAKIAIKLLVNLKLCGLALINFFCL